MTKNPTENYSIGWLDKIRASILFSDSYGNCIYANRYWREYIGRDLKEGKGNEWHSLIHEEDRENYLKRVEVAIADNKEYSVELRLKKDTGEYCWVEDKGKPVVDDAGKYVGNISTFTDISEKKIQERERQKLLEEKSNLVHDVIHRTKNNMAVVLGMFDLHFDYIEDKNDQVIFQSLQNRVASMSLIHENIYRSETLGKMNFKIFVEEIVKRVKNNFSGELEIPLTVKIEVEENQLELTKAMPCGLIVNELITNVFKHAFKAPAVIEGELSIMFSKRSGKYTLLIEDNGVGIKDEALVKSPLTLGYILINALVQQLNGVIEINSKKGFSVKVTF